MQLCLLRANAPAWHLNEYVVTISINGEIKPLDVYTRSTRTHLCVVRRSPLPSRIHVCGPVDIQHMSSCLNTGNVVTFDATDLIEERLAYQRIWWSSGLSIFGRPYLCLQCVSASTLTTTLSLDHTHGDRKAMQHRFRRIRRLVPHRGKKKLPVLVDTN
jgi:hypothetical protein